MDKMEINGEVWVKAKDAEKAPVVMTFGGIIENCRRLWHHRPKDVKTSWYEGIAVSGLSENSKVSNTVPSKVIVEDYSLTLCNAIAEKSIMEATPNAQS
jgi:hypothetical protein